MFFRITRDCLMCCDHPGMPGSFFGSCQEGSWRFLSEAGFACMKAFIIDREDLKQSMQVIVNVIREVKAGRNYLIFPEGTRSKTEIIRGRSRGRQLQDCHQDEMPDRSGCTDPIPLRLLIPALQRGSPYRCISFLRCIMRNTKICIPQSSQKK